MELCIELLADHADLIPTLAGWFYAQWGPLNPGSSLEGTLRTLRAHLNRDRLPLTLVALRGPELVGSASLRPADLVSRPDLSPWLASVYVERAHRRQGIGSQIVAAAEAKARELGIGRLYLFTYDQEHFYSGLGWSVLGPGEQRGHAVTVMHKRLEGLPVPPPAATPTGPAPSSAFPTSTRQAVEPGAPEPGRPGLHLPPQMPGRPSRHAYPLWAELARRHPQFGKSRLTRPAYSSYSGPK